MNQSVPFLSATQATPVQTSRPVRSKTSLVHRAVHQRLRRLLAMFFFFITVPALGQEQLGADIDGEARLDQSGYSVSLSADGRTVAIGARGNDGKGIEGSISGHTRIFDWDGSAWSQRGADIDGEANFDRSGHSVSLSADGNTVAIGAPFNEGNGTSSGHTRIFDWDGSAWSQRGADIDGEARLDQSGYSVALSANGNTVTMGARENEGNGSRSGHTRIFDWDGSAWRQRGADIDSEAAGDQSGHSVALSADSNTVAIGARLNSGNRRWSGHTRIFDWDGSAWRQRGADIDGEAFQDQSGYSVALSADGNTVAIGARDHGAYRNVTGSGHTRIFDWDGSSWSQRGADIDGATEGDQSGYSVSLSADGNTVAIGARGNDGNGSFSGHTRIFDWDGTAWSQRDADIDGEAGGDESGYSVALSADGNTVAIGAPLNDGNGFDSGHVRVYTYASGCGNPGQDPLAQIADLVAYIEQLNIAKGISNALDVKLDAAARALSDLNAQNDVAAINLMYAFCDNALAQSGKKLEPAEVEELTCRADQIVALLDPQAASCGG